MKTTSVWAFTVYRTEPFKFHVVETFETREEAREVRSQWVSQDKSFGEYSLTTVYKLEVQVPEQK